MTPLTTLLDKYVFQGVPSNAVWDLLKAGYEKATECSWEELYLNAFAAAVEEERPWLERHGDHVALEREDLSRVLHQDLGAAVEMLPLSHLTDKQFAGQLAAALADRQALIIGGYNLSQDDYAQLVRNLVARATGLFKAAAIEHAFQQAVIGQSLHDHTLLIQTQAYLAEHFDLVLQALSLLPEIRSDTEAIRSDAAAIRRSLEIGPPAPSCPIPTRIPESKAGTLVGREQAVTAVSTHLLTSGVAAIAAVGGMGGIGKTEVAIASVRRLRSQFEDRVIWLEGGANDVFAIQGRLAEALGVRLETENVSARADVLHFALKNGPPRLIVLDDLRRHHLAAFDHLKPPCPPCALLITTRRTDLPALPEGALLPLPALDPEHSLELLRLLLPEGWIEAEPEAAARVVEFLGGIPLAIGLAARRCRAIAGRRGAWLRQGNLSLPAEPPLAALLAEMEARWLEVLNQGEDATRPNLSVVITFDASYHDLEPADQARLRRLGVFARSEFELPALAAVWGDDEAAARLAVQRLAHAGLVEEDYDDTWWMHDLLHEYAKKKLDRADAGEGELARLAHAAYWQRYLKKLDLRPIEAWMALEACRPDVKAAANWLLSGSGCYPETAAALAVQISRTFRGYTFPEWQGWLVAGMEASEASGQHSNSGRLQRSLGELYQWQGRTAEAEVMLRASLATAQTAHGGDGTVEATNAAQRNVAVTQSSLAYLLGIQGKYDEAERLYRESMEVTKLVGDRRELAVMQSHLADVLFVRGHHDEAERLYRESLQVLEDAGDQRSAAVTQSNLADLLRLQGQYGEAVHLYRESLQVLEDVGDQRSVAVTQSRLAGLLRLRDQYDEAEQLYGESLKVTKQVGDRYALAVTQSSLADLLSLRGRYDEAERLYSESLQVFQEAHDRRSVAIAQSCLADLLCMRGQYGEAEHLYRESMEVTKLVGDRRDLAVTQSSLADLLRLRGQHDDAEHLYRETLQILEDVGDQRSAAVTQSNLADSLGLQGQYDEAERLYRESLRVFERVGDRREMAITQSSLADLLSLQGQYDEAEQLYRESLYVKEQVGDRRIVAITKVSLADLLSLRGQHEEAEGLYRAGLATSKDVGDPHTVAAILLRLGRLDLDRGCHIRALPVLQEARQCFVALNLPQWIRFVDEMLVRVEEVSLGGNG